MMDIIYRIGMDFGVSSNLVCSPILELSSGASSFTQNKQRHVLYRIIDSPTK